MREKTRRLGKLVAKCGVLALLAGMLVYSLSPQSPFPTRWPWQHTHHISTHPGVESPITHYGYLPIGRAPAWFKEDIDAITKAMNTWVAPAEDPARGDDFGGCRANRNLATVVSKFQADLNTRPMTKHVAAIQQQLRNSVKEMETGAHLRDRMCGATGQHGVLIDRDAAISEYRGMLLVEKGYTRLRLTCLSLAPEIK